MSPSTWSETSSPGSFLPEIIESDELTGVLLRKELSPNLVEILPVDSETFDEPPGLILTPLLLKANRDRVLNLSKLGLSSR